MQKLRSRSSELNKIYKIKFYKYNFKKIMFHHHFATFGNIVEVCKMGVFQWDVSTIFLKVLNIYLF